LALAATQIAAHFEQLVFEFSALARDPASEVVIAARPVASMVALLAWAIAVAYVGLALPRLKRSKALAATGLLSALCIGLPTLSSFFGVVGISATAALVALILGHVLYGLAFEEPAEAQPAEAASASSVAPDHRLLALAARQQGRLDLAFEHLRKCAITDAVMSELNELALDLERRRQFRKAQAVFDFMARHDSRYRNVQQRPAARNKAEDAIDGYVVNYESTPAAPAATSDSAKVLGRYELVKELGRGAMGVVYLGKDPKIGRVVAVKTMPLSTEFEASELEGVRKRFFGEAESAGRLNHPNIVTIFDVGEDHGLAYIAMELLAGKDLARYTKPETKLPLSTVLSIVARVAEALDYAHRMNVVHRDIKPGNIMYDASTDTVKVTDFGIARITDSSKTKTGMVLGTPSFMSPEQLAGKKIDGQSDLYSLGVTAYQLICGVLPFQAASLAQLMYKISNEPPTDPLVHNPSLPEGLVQVLNTALAKDKADRFAAGAQMAAALRECAKVFASLDLAL